jgi:hypothetical protein
MNTTTQYIYTNPVTVQPTTTVPAITQPDLSTGTKPDTSINQNVPPIITQPVYDPNTITYIYNPNIDSSSISPSTPTPTNPTIQTNPPITYPTTVIPVQPTYNPISYQYSYNSPPTHYLRHQLKTN